MKRWIGLLFLTGCVVGPDYQTQHTAVCEDWVEPCDQVELTADCCEPDCEWWRNFNDPMLDCYIEMAKSYNNKVQTAEYNILVSRAIRRENMAAFFPQINGDISASRTAYSKNGPLFFLQENQGGVPFPQIHVPFYQNLYNVLFDATWEIDLFGKNARTVEASQRQLESTIENQRDILVSVLAETAKNYIDVRAAQAKMALAKKNVGFLEENLKLTELRYKKGLDNELDVLRVEGDMESLLATIPTYEAEIYKGIYSLSVLTGNDPQTLVEEMLPCHPLPVLQREICIGLRSDLLLRRPDVRRAERNLAAAVAQIGIAKASFFPSFSLLGNGGLQSLQVRNLFQAHSTTWSYGLDFNFPIFQGGYLIASYQASYANAQAIAFEYQETVLEALKDAESALVSYAEDLEALEHLETVVLKYGRLRDLSFKRYKEGLVNLMDFLDRENDLIHAEENLLNQEAQGLVDLIALYKALGGGWQCCDLNPLQ